MRVIMGEGTGAEPRVQRKTRDTSSVASSAGGEGGLGDGDVEAGVAGVLVSGGQVGGGEGQGGPPSGRVRPVAAKDVTFHERARRERGRQTDAGVRTGE